MLSNLSKNKFSIVVISFITLATLFVIRLYHLENTIPKLFIAQTGSHSQMANSIDLAISEELSQKTASVYRMKKVDASAEQKRIKELLGDSSNVKAPDFNFNSKNGCWSYTTDIAYYTGENVPSKEEAIKIADAFIRENAIYPYHEIGKPTANPLTSGDGIFEPKKALCWDISYYPQVGGKDVYGVFRITVSVGSNGEIVSVFKLASEYELVEEVPVKNREQLYSDFKNGAFTLSGDEPELNTVLSEAKVIYYVEAESQYIQPVYVVSDKNHGTEIIIDAHER